MANPASCSALSGVAEGAAETAFRQLPLQGQIDKVVWGGVVDLTGEADNEMTVGLERAVARFDLKIEAGRRIQVDAVTFDGLPKGGMLFAAPYDYTERATKTLNVNTDTSIEGVNYSYELPLSAGGLVATLDVKYNGISATLLVPINEIKRNYIYNIGVYAYDGKVSAALEASSMEEGDSDTGVAVYPHTTIDQPQSTLGNLASLISPTLVQLPNRDYEITLALTGDYDKTYTVDGNTDDFEITAVQGSKYKNQKLNIKTTFNSNYGYGGRAAMLIVTHVEPGGVTLTDRIGITQAPPEPAKPVTIGGLEWFPFNAIGQDMGLYSTVPAGKTVREVLKANWYKYAEACYQWGPRKSYKTVSPFYAWWVQGGAFNNTNGPITAMPAGNIWQGETVPCPTGWRLPTYEECEKIWAPNGTELPQTYTKQGVTYTMSLEESGLTIELPVHGKRTLYNVVISDGTNELIFPAGGVRYENNVDHDGAINGFAAKVGSSLALRTQKAANNSGHNAGVGYAVQTQNPNTPSRVVLTPGTHSITVGQTYCYIRCVRNIE